MKIGIRYYENATCRVSQCMGVPASMRQAVREISHVDVPENLRNHGMATQLLINVCDEADAHKKILVLFPEPFGNTPSMTQEQLEYWYESKFGFQVIQEEPKRMMARMVGATPKIFTPTFMAEVINKVTK
jgi:predicted GNAT family acetyltransferase